MIAKPIPGALLPDIPGYPRSLNLTRKGYIPSISGVIVPIVLMFTFEYCFGVTETLILSSVVTFSTGMINSQQQLHLQLL